ncbi:hypothetical protein INT44_005988 [Umbelopsis vinacea]|uniref:Uncharacterized protein n=1 Tax=Umbelopsis vinacea TaxID=44442 RepID=A0A8H7UIJ0_9FUNG|nr:hypothetical protein INT44_005988 [Umbelopsis vinacea]KAI9282052.1 hypothetical protein BC943DRAFT_309727 [Umbelopsis sp. AD052]
MVKALTITVLATFAASAYAATIPNPHYLCGCFQPDYDYGCCTHLNGLWDGTNSCIFPNSTAKVTAFQSCCKGIGGKETKCKLIHTSD